MNPQESKIKQGDLIEVNISGIGIILLYVDKVFWDVLFYNCLVICKGVIKLEDWREKENCKKIDWFYRTLDTLNTELIKIRMDHKLEYLINES